MATPFSTLHGSTGNSIIDSLLSGAQWSLGTDRVLTWGTGDNADYFWLNPSEAQAILQPAFNAWEAVANINFVYAGHAQNFNFSNSDITLTITDSSVLGSAVAEAVFPYTPYGNFFNARLGANRFVYPQPEGDIAFNIDYNNIYSFTNPGSKAFYVTLHEIGHSLGLKHSHDNGLAGFPTFSEIGLGDFDSAFYTVMSYEPTSLVIPEGHSATPMPLDILAIQSVYGANPLTGAGNSVYNLADDAIVKTIYDISGTDTLTASFSTQPVIINLNEAEFSFIGSRTAVTTAFGTIIENAEGSQSSDVIIGNQAANRLEGKNGDDVIAGQDGSDIIFGENGNDILYGNKNTDLLLGGTGNDTLYGGQNDGIPSGTPLALRDGIDSVSGEDGEDLLYGNHGADLLDGGQGSDTIFGGQDDDTLSGGLGDDVLIGNLGRDVFLFSNTNEGTDQIFGFETLGDTLGLSSGVSLVSITVQSTDTILTLSSGTAIKLIGVSDFSPTALTLV